MTKKNNDSQYMIRWKRRHNQPYYYLPRVWQTETEAKEEYAKLRKGGGGEFYRIELVELNPKVVEHDISQAEVVEPIQSDG
jgi:hypothetical protein